MALTFTSYKNQTNDVLQRGIVNTVARTSDLLAEIPVEKVDSLLYRYNTTDYNTTLDFVDAGEGFENTDVEAEAVILELKHMGTYADVSLQHVRGGNVADLRANVTEVKTENFAKNLEEKIFYADGTSKAFKGFDQFITDGIGTKVEKAISYDALCEVVDAVPNASAIYMNRKTLRAVEKAIKTEGYTFGSVTTEGGKLVKAFNEVAIFPTETIKDNEIFVIEYSAKGCGLLVCGDLINTMDMGLLENQPIYRTMIEGSYAPIVRQKGAIAKLEVPMLRTAKK